jgi:hypothetical protein
MKLRDKDARARFFVRDPADGSVWTVRPGDHLTRWQASKMAGQPDMILQFAHHLAARAREAGRPGVQVRARVTASLNGRRPQLLVDPETDLAAQPRSLSHAPWILPLTEPLPRRAAPDPPDSDE